VVPVLLGRRGHRPAALIGACLALVGCGEEAAVAASVGQLRVEPGAELEFWADPDLEQDLERSVLLINEGPASIDVRSTRLAPFEGEDAFSLQQGFEAELRRGEEAELIVRYAPTYQGTSEALLSIFIDGAFVDSDLWPEQLAEITLLGTAAQQ
jgi:hypothetical protein